MISRLKTFFAREDGAITVDWVVLTALVVGLCGAGFYQMRDGTQDLSNGVNSYMSETPPGEF